jgi:hypothetical protein
LLPDDARRAESDVVGIESLAGIILVGLSPRQIVKVVRPERDIRITDPAGLDVERAITLLQSGPNRLGIHDRPGLAVGLLDPELGIGFDDLRGGVSGE